MSQLGYRSLMRDTLELWLSNIFLVFPKEPNFQSFQPLKGFVDQLLRQKLLRSTPVPCSLEKLTWTVS